MKLNKSFIRSLIKKREKNSHKGDFGHVLVVAGSKGMAGAAALSANGALRSGAGLVTAAVPADIYTITAKQARPEIMVFPYANIKQLFDFIRKRKISILAIGPGLGVSAKTKAIVKKAVNELKIPIVLDADALNTIAGTDILEKAKADIVITPHQKEFSRLSCVSVLDMEKSRISVAKEFARKNKVVYVLKGNKTVVSDGNITYLNNTGNPGMATAGSGDVLTGIIAALLSQVKEPRPLNAAAAGVYIHGLAGDLAAKEKTQVSLIASDISENIHKAFKRVING